MLDSDYWKELGNQFRSITEDSARVGAQWIGVPGSASIENWQIWGGKLTPRLQFEALARRGGAKLQPECKDALAAWLSALKREGRRDLVTAGGNIDHFQDGLVTHSNSGRIQCVCAVSADYCLVLESRALDQERIALQAAQHDTRELGSSVEVAQSSRRTEVDNFLKACNSVSKLRIRRKHIWSSVGHTKPRQFEYWQAEDKHATTEDERNFGRVLQMKPDEFLSLLRRKHLLPETE